MFDTVLVADRGAPARRVVRTCQRLGSQALTVHSAADAGAAHVRDADESLRLGGHDLTSSYLDGTKLLEAAGQGAAQAVHPGSGPLATSAGFARAVLDAGLAWLGAPPEALEVLAAPPPGSPAGRSVDVHLLTDGERMLVLADSALDGGLVLCPAPDLTAEQRHAVQETAIAAVGRAGLVGVATVTVALADSPVVAGVLPALGPDHPAVELVTGLDLVEQQLLRAEGARLPDASLTGAAALTSLHAAAPGVLTAWSPPTGDGVRVESAVEQGDATPPYDDLLATLAVHAPDAGAARRLLEQARAQWVIAGIEVRSGA